MCACDPSISGPGATPYGIMATTTSAQVGAPGTPSARVGSAAPASFAFWADSAKSTPSSDPLPNSERSFARMMPNA